jgi:HK97 gp10 family phage protein
MARFKRNNKVFKKLDSDREKRLDLVGTFVATAAKLNAAVNTGYMRGSIYHEVIRQGSAVRIGAAAEYAPFVEFGTRKMIAQPFLFPAVIDNKQSILKLLSGD